jgi:hypothetical protein
MDPLDWNFDAVPDDELVGCCYWEYARESFFIRDTLQKYRDWYLAGGRWSDARPEIGKNLERIQAIGYVSEVFVRGCAFKPDFIRQSIDPEKPDYRHPDTPVLTGSFPKPWQALTQPERDYRKHIGTDVERIPLLPFQRGTCLDAKYILDWVNTQRARADSERERVRRENPKLNEETLVRLGKLRFPEIKPAIFWAGGKEATVVQIEWGSFTNDKIVNYFRQWVKANRPRRYPVPTQQGRKPKDWRANLTRLAVMRLLARFTALEIIDPRLNRFPAVWESKQFSGRKWGDSTKWHDARREAGKLLRTLFPFLPKDDKPLSWERQQPAK